MRVSATNDELIRSLWNTIAPSEIGRRARPIMTATQVRATAAELGLSPDAWPSRPSFHNKPNTPARELSNGMIEFAPGHVCSPETFKILKR